MPAIQSSHALTLLALCQNKHLVDTPPDYGIHVQFTYDHRHRDVNQMLGASNNG